MTQTGDTPGPEADPRKPIYKDLLLIQLAAIVFLLDQFSKFLVREFLVFRESYPVEGFFRFTHSHNTGSAFGILQDQNGPLILVSLIGITVLGFIYQSQRRPSNLLRLSLGLQMGGAAGNLLDRVLLGHVIDFIDVGTWPIFNLADSSIVVGLGLLAWLFLRPDRFGAGKPSATGIYAWCPICDGEMLASGHGWHCSDCGVREKVEAGHGLLEPPAVAEQRATASGNGPIPRVPAEVIQTSAVPPSEDASSSDLATGQMPVMDSEGTSPPFFKDELGDETGSSGTIKPL